MAHLVLQRSPNPTLVLILAGHLIIRYLQASGTAFMSLYMFNNSNYFIITHFIYTYISVCSFDIKQTTKAMLSKGNLALAYNRRSSVTLTCAVNHNQLMMCGFFYVFHSYVVELLIGLQCFLNTLQIRCHT